MQRLPFVCSAAQEVLFSLLIYPNPLPVVTSLDKAGRKKVSLEMQKGRKSPRAFLEPLLVPFYLRSSLEPANDI